MGYFNFFFESWQLFRINSVWRIFLINGVRIKEKISSFWHVLLKHQNVTMICVNVWVNSSVFVMKKRKPSVLMNEIYYLLLTKTLLVLDALLGEPLTRSLRMKRIQD